MNGKSNKNKGSNRKPREKENYDRDAAGSTLRGSRGSGRGGRITHNDPSWYRNYPELTRNVGNLPFVFALGPHYGSVIEQIPAVMILHTLFTPGIAKDGMASINVSSRLTWTKERATTSGYKYTDPQDTAEIQFSIANLYAFWYMLKRLYGTILAFNAQNKFVPRYFVESMYIDYDDIISNLADLRAYINYLATALEAWPVTKDYHIIDKYDQIMSNIYCDVNSPQAQLYIYHPNGFWSYDEANGGCAWNDMPTNATFADLKTLGDTLLRALSDSETAVLVAGNIFRAYPESALRGVSPIEDNYRVTPIYDLETLITIQNTICPGVPDVNTLVISQDANNLDVLFDPVFIQAPYYSAQIPYWALNIPMDNVTPEMVLSATSDMNFETVFDASDPTQPKYKLDSCGSEIITSFSMAYLDTDDSTIIRLVSSTINYSISSAGGQWGQAAIRSMLNRHNLISKFDWHPRIGDFLVNAANYVTYSPDDFQIDITKFTVIKADVLKRIHDVRMMNYYTTPEPTFK